ncbi:MAG: hypothetical protein ACRDL4_00495, partial [Thermoleophilaceae bacterium]
MRCRHAFVRARRAFTTAAVGTLALLALLAGVAWASHEDPSSPDDPLYADQWGPQQVRVEPAWHRSV